MKKLRVLVITDLSSAPSLDFNLESELKTNPDWKVEHDVLKALHKLEHETKLLLLFNDLTILLKEVSKFKPDVVFNLTETFRDNRELASPLTGVLDLLGIAYTGASAQTLSLCNNKALTKKLLLYHGIGTPHFKIASLRRELSDLKNFPYPAFVKPICQEGSEGIAQSSIVKSFEDCVRRVKFVHKKFQTDALVEQYIEGREFYLSMLANKEWEVLAAREMRFEKVPIGSPKIATHHAKFDEDYQKKWGIRSVKPSHMAEDLIQYLRSLGIKIGQALNLDGYVRMDLRVTSDQKVYVLEVNPNPSLAKDEDFALSASDEGYSYEELIQHILDRALLKKSRLALSVAQRS
ncbi:MAG: ATP-grasp domain-containing protein [Deltaproteobacteria bacterium]|nr:ATP-grasp domain-containing protein [Deltaproteobacteria bacterium]